MAHPPTSHKERPAWMRHIGALWRSRHLGPVLGAIAIIGCVVLSVLLHGAVDGANHAKNSANDAKSAYKNLAGKLAKKNDANCVAAGKNCVGNSKQVVKSLPTSVQSVVSPVVPSQAAASGAPGRGIVSTDITAGHLIVHYTDGTKQDAGVAAGGNGKNGTDGKNGAAGRGIRTTAITAGDFIVSYTDGSSKNLGQVVGPAGRGVSAAAIVSGHLIVTYTDRTAVDVGQVVGANGVDGTSVTNLQVDANGDLQVTLTAADGSTKEINAGHVVGPPGHDGTDGKDAQPAVSWTDHAPDGTVRKICTRSDDFDPDAPTYQCTDVPTPSSPPPSSPSPSP